MQELDYVGYDVSAQMSKRWHAVDFDGTLAEGTGTMKTCGKPIPTMVARVKEWIANGEDVRIFTARVSGGPTWAEFVVQQRAMIQAWCLEHIGVILEVTCRKDFSMIDLWDDRANWVDSDTGQTYRERIADLESQIRVLQLELRR